MWTDNTWLCKYCKYEKVNDLLFHPNRISIIIHYLPCIAPCVIIWFDSLGSRSSVCNIRNISMVSSENFACSHAEPTIIISWRLSVMCGDRSHGGVVNGLNLEPEPLHINCEDFQFRKNSIGYPCFRIIIIIFKLEKCECVRVFCVFST